MATGPHCLLLLTTLPVLHSVECELGKAQGDGRHLRPGRSSRVLRRRSRRDEPLYKSEGNLAYLPPAAVDGERVPSAGDLDELGHAYVALLDLVGGLRDRAWDGVIFLA